MTFITPSKVFSHLDRLQAWQRGGTPAPVTVEWDLTNRCSLGCQSCHFAHTHTRGPWTSLPRPYTVDVGDQADTMTVVHGLSQMAAAGVQGIVWSGGGEPTLHPGFMEIVHHASVEGLRQGLYTHGGHLTQAVGETLSYALTWAVVSLDACDAATYGREKHVPPERFEAACQGIRWLVAGRGPCTVGVSYLVHEGNWTRLEAMRDHGRSLGADYVTFRPTILTHPERPSQTVESATWISCATPTLRRLAAEPDVEVSVARFHEYRDWVSHPYPACHAIKLHATVTPDGQVWVCPNRRGQPSSSIGNMTTESFGAIWARHPREWTDFTDCRVMCRLHAVNQMLAPVFAGRQHEAFV